jgi:predicted ATPase/class 3 adenylate cyclase/tetratricopeptide (TPR) repeat protein
MAEAILPSGIVTFLLTDIEGSTRLFRRLGDDYPDILDTHNRILRNVWADHHGYEIDTEGDSFLVAFDSADRAISAAAAGQRALAEMAWPESVKVEVRMGLHSGLAAPRNDEYVSMAVYQASRVIETAHGGQIVLSEDTEFLATDHLDLSLRPLGRFRVRDFVKPVRLFQVVGNGLRENFPALRATPADQHNIVPRPTATIGRDDIITAVAARVSARQLITLSGPGGVGKSRIAQDVGLAIAPEWTDGVWFVELAPVEEPDLVAGAVAEAIGAPLRSDGARTDDLLQHLADRTAVVILDNCEHIADACSKLVRRIEADCPDVAVLSTSREPLRVPGEVVWPVHPLGVPAISDEPRAVLDADSVRLFQERGEAVRPGLSLTNDNTEAVAAIVRHLDGIPLLIELAAAHLSAHSPREILRGLEDSFNYLKARDFGLSDRHRTIEGLMAWSYRLLEEREQAAFRRLSVFASSFSLTTAKVVSANGDVRLEDVDELVWALVEKSLIEADFESEDTTYRLLETVRSFSRQRLDAEGETESIAVKLARWFLERTGPWLPPDGAWLGQVGSQLDNLRALTTLIPEESQELAQQIACTIGLYHDASQSFIEGIGELTRLADLLSHPSASRVAMLTTLADLHLRTGQVDRAEEYVEAATELHAEYGYPAWDDVAIERTRGEIAKRTGDLSGAAEIARRTLTQPTSERGQARMYNLLGITSAALGELDTAFDACQHELELYERLGYEGNVSIAHGNLAEVALRLGDLASAAEHQHASLLLAVAQGTPAPMAFSLMIAARIAGWRGEWKTAVKLHTRAEEQLDEIGLVLYEDDLAQSQKLLTQARENLGDHAFDEAAATAEAMSVNDAVMMAEDVLVTTRDHPVVS